MPHNYLRNLVISAIFGAILALSAHRGSAENVGDQYYPTAGDNASSAAKIESDDQTRTQSFESEYKKNLEAIDKRYSEKNTTNQAYISEKTALREKYAALKEERMRKRAEMDEAIMKHKEELANTQYEKLNQYVIDSKDREDYFEGNVNSSTDAVIKLPDNDSPMKSVPVQESLPPLDLGK